MLMSAMSCGSEDTVDDVTAENTTASSDETTESSRLTELGSKDFQNRTFMIMDANDYPTSNIIYPEDSPNGDIINDALYDRNAKIEELYKVKIKYEHMDPAKNGTDAVRQSVLAGDAEYDLINSTIAGGTLGTIATEGILANLADVPYLSLDQSWWSSLMYENLKLNDRLYFTSGDISYRIYVAPHATYVNAGLMEDYGIDKDIYDLVLNGKWTIDELVDMTKGCNQDINGDGVMHTNDDFFGVVFQQHNSLATNALSIAAGVKLSEVKGDTITVDLANEKVLSAVEKLKSLVIENFKFDTQNDIYLKAFSENRAIVCIHLMSTAMNEKMRNMDNDFLIVPLPKYDEKQETYRSLVNSWNNAFVAIPQNADMEFSGFITEAMAYESYVSVRPKFYELVLKEKLTRDARTKDMIDIITETAYLDFNAVYEFGGSTSLLLSAITQDAPLASSLASSQTAVDAAVAELVENWNQAAE